MLDLYKILWVAPGTVFVFLYNRKRPLNSISLSGWSYVFFLVTIATITWMPAEWIVEKGWGTDCIPILHNISKTSLTLIYSVIFSFLIRGTITIYVVLFKPRAVQPLDDFYGKCMKWEEQLVILTLKNRKSYIGLLWKYSENFMDEYEFQTISIVPYASGYRDEEAKIVWNTMYPDYESELEIMDMETIIPRAEIVNFGKFNARVFNYFYKKRTSDEDVKEEHA